MSEITGLLNIIKPPGLTSFKVVQIIRRLACQKKVGHTGTLDPLAVGVLPICLGRATKLIRFLPEEKKQYIFEMELGIKTDTIDREGRILEKNNSWQALSIKDIKELLTEFQGEIGQVPPMYSAVKKDGEPLYKLARKGENITREERRVEIYSSNILAVDLPRIRISLLCSRGTYIRSLVRDIGDRLNCGAVLNFLLRTESGPFSLDKGLPLNQLAAEPNLIPEKLTSLKEPLSYQELTVKEDAFKYAINGASLYPHNFQKFSLSLENLSQRYIITGPKDEFIAISKVIKDEQDNLCLHPEKVFYQANSS